MRTLWIRSVALLLVPCLVADPSMAAVFGAFSEHVPRMTNHALFEDQALAETSEFSTHLLPRSFQGFKWLLAVSSLLGGQALFLSAQNINSATPPPNPLIASRADRQWIDRLVGRLLIPPALRPEQFKNSIDVQKFSSKGHSIQKILSGQATLDDRHYLGRGLLYLQAFHLDLFTELENETVSLAIVQDAPSQALVLSDNHGLILLNENDLKDSGSNSDAQAACLLADQVVRYRGAKQRIYPRKIAASAARVRAEILRAASQTGSDESSRDNRLQEEANRQFFKADFLDGNDMLARDPGSGPVDAAMSAIHRIWGVQTMLDYERSTRDGQSYVVTFKNAAGLRLLFRAVPVQSPWEMTPHWSAFMIRSTQQDLEALMQMLFPAFAFGFIFAMAGLGRPKTPKPDAAAAPENIGRNQTTDIGNSALLMGETLKTFRHDLLIGVRLITGNASNLLEALNVPAEMLSAATRIIEIGRQIEELCKNMVGESPVEERINAVSSIKSQLETIRSIWNSVPPYRESLDRKEKADFHFKWIGKAADHTDALLEMVIGHQTESRFDLNPELQPLTVWLSELFANDGIYVAGEWGDNLPLVHGHPIGLRRVITNLSFNAKEALINHTYPQTIVVTTFWDAARRQVGLRVADNGPGINREHLSGLFDGFTTKVDKSSDHGGTIEVNSEVGKGTIFTIYLPAATPEKKHSPGSQALDRAA